MDFDFSDDAKALREQARTVFAERAGPAAARASMDGDAAIEAALWRTIVDLGWTAARVPEAHGGVGLTCEAACVLAEEAGRALAPIPFIQTLAATEALIALGTDAQQARWLPGIADGSVVAVTGWAEGGSASPRISSSRPAHAASAARCSGVAPSINSAATLSSIASLMVVPPVQILREVHAKFTVTHRRFRSGDGR